MGVQSGKTGRFSYPFRPDSGYLGKKCCVSSLNKPQKSFSRKNGQKEGTPSSTSEHMLGKLFYFHKGVLDV